MEIGKSLPRDLYQPSPFNEEGYFSRYTAYSIKDQLKDKDRALNRKIQYMLIRLINMFRWEGLPDEIPVEELERYLIEYGQCLFTKHNETYYVVHGGYGANPDAYARPRDYLVANPYIPLNKTYHLDEDDNQLIRNDPRSLGLVQSMLGPLSLLVEGDLTSYVMMINARSMGLIQADDDKAAASANEYLNALEEGDHSVITTTQFSNLIGIKTHEPFNTTQSVPYFIDLYQYIKSALLADLGISANNNMKREYVSDGEAGAGDLYTLTLPEIMLQERERAVEEINRKFGLSISVELNSAWKFQLEKVEAEIEEIGEINEEPETSEEIGDDETTTDQDNEEEDKPEEDDNEDEDEGGETDDEDDDEDDE